MTNSFKWTCFEMPNNIFSHIFSSRKNIITKILASLYLALIFSLKLYGDDDYSVIDKKSLTIPVTLKSADQIAKYLTKGLTTDKDKVRAFYMWISHNIRYDMAYRNKIKKYKSKNEIIKEVLEKKLGVCEHYAELFHILCQKSGIKSYVINGYSRQSTGEIRNIGHSWNAVLIDSKFYNIDVTWASGYILNNKLVHEFHDDFFLVESEIFLKTHLPFDPIWQFSDNPINIIDFNNQDYSKLTIHGSYNYRKEIAGIEKQDTITSMEQSNQRIINSGELTDLALREVSQNIEQVNFIKCKIVVDTLNYSIDQYNLYIKHKNSRFKEPMIEDNQLMDLLNRVERPLSKTSNMVRSIFTFNNELNSRVIGLKNKVQDLGKKLETEKEFINKYIETPKTLRFLLFH